MQGILTLLFPFSAAFDRLELEKRWWHRLSIVIFVIAIILVLLSSWGLTFASLEPSYQSEPNIRFWVENTNGTQDDLGTPPAGATGVAPEGSKAGLGNGDIFDQIARERKGDSKGFSVGPLSNTDDPVLDMSKSLPIRAEVAMPNGSVKEYSGKSKNEIDADWNAACRRALVREWCLSIVAAVSSTLALSYTLQALYRALLYVVFGRMAISEGSRR